MSSNLTVVLQELLQNTSNLKVLQQLMSPDVTYVSLISTTVNWKTLCPGPALTRGRGRCSMSSLRSNASGKLDFTVTDTIEQGSRVAFFGSFTYKSNVTGKEITSPFSLLARFEGEKDRVHPVSRRQQWHCGFVQNRRRHTVPQRSLGERV